MKKIFILIWFLFLIFWYSKAESISDIQAYFCDNWESLNITTDSAKVNEICVKFSNKSDKNIDLKIWFPDSEITNDSFKVKACKSEWKIENFWQYVISDKKNILIPAKSEIEKKIYIKFPAWYEWISRWCITYFLNNQQDPNNMINIIVRKKLFIEALVWSNFKREVSIESNSENKKLFSANPKINIKKDDLNNWIIASVSIINSWDIDELFNWTGIIKNNYWVYREFVFENTEIKAQSKKEISVSLKDIPFYKWSYIVQIKWKISPQILFNKNSLKEELKKTIQIQEQTKIFIIPRNIIIWFLLLIIIIILIIKKNRPNR